MTIAPVPTVLDASDDLVTLTTDIVTAYLRHNVVAADRLHVLIHDVYHVLMELSASTDRSTNA